MLQVSLGPYSSGDSVCFPILVMTLSALFSMYTLLYKRLISTLNQPNTLRCSADNCSGTTLSTQTHFRSQIYGRNRIGCDSTILPLLKAQLKKIYFIIYNLYWLIEKKTRIEFAKIL